MADDSVTDNLFSYEDQCGTFTPYHVIDTKYLESLISKGRNNRSSFKLIESASLATMPRKAFFIQSQEKGISSKLEISPDLLTVPESQLQPSMVIQTSMFFHECDIQISKLFSFMEFHLSKIESQIETVRRIGGKNSIHNPSNEDQGAESLSDDSTDSSVDESEEQLLPTLGGDESHIERSITFLGRLREVLVSVQESLSDSFSALDALVDMHDFHHDSKKGREFFEKKTPRKEAFEKRVEECMDDLDNEMNKLYRKQKLKIDGRIRDRTESEITDHQLPVSCITYFHALLFVVTLGLIVFMYLYKFDDTQKWIVYLRLLRGPFLILLFLYLYGVNLKVWALKRINFVNIFANHPKGTPTPNYIFKVCGIFCVFFSIIIIALLVSSPFTGELPGKIAPLVMWISLVLFIVNPLKILLRRGRLSLLLVFVRILLAPFTFVYFGDFWLADQLNSTVAVLLDLQYITCYIIADTWYGNVGTFVCTSSGNGIRPVISCLPALWRLLQCVRCYYDTKNVKHLLNAVKYFTVFPIVIFATMFITKVGPNFDILALDWPDVGWILVLWLISSLVHAVYTFVWDIYCDWGLWDFSKGTYYRKHLMFRHKIIYLTAIVIDLLLRFVWPLKISLAIAWHLDSDLIYTGLVVAEIFRRFIWNFFRVEFAHVLEYH